MRNIDDLSEFSVNMTYGTPEKLDLGGVDEVVSLASQWRKIADLQVVHGENGTGFRGPLHPHYIDENNLKLVGRCLDLKSAYKQIALRPMGVYDPKSERVRYFVSRVLPFAATGAVMGFNRVARALRDIMQKLLYIPTVNYFDDYPHIEVVGMWQVSLEAKKRLPPCPKFTVLGVVIDLTKSVEGLVVVKNKPERIGELRETIKEAKETRTFSSAMAARVQGRLLYAEAQCSGRWLTPLLEPVKARALMPRTVRSRHLRFCNGKGS